LYPGTDELEVAGVANPQRSPRSNSRKENTVFSKLKIMMSAALLCALMACGGGGGGGAPAAGGNGPAGLSLSGTVVYNFISDLYAVNMQTGATRTLLKLDLNLSFVGAAVGPAGEFVVAYNIGTTGPNSRIYILNPDGSQERTFTLGYTIQGAPRFSPDGTKIAFRAGVYRNGTLSYFAQVISRAGQDVYSYADFQAPHWLPAGGLVLSSSDGVYVDPAPEDQSVQIVQIPNSAIAGLGLADVSRDGKQISFVRRTASGAPRHIYVMNIDGSGTRQVTTSANGEETNAVFSPDGKNLLIRSSGCITAGSSQGVGSVDDDLLHVIPADSNMLSIDGIRNTAPTALRDEQGQGRCTGGVMSWR
jgi:Tol biopolymer transport system component